MICTTAPKAGALPDCATPRRAETLRLEADQRASANAVRGNTRQNMAGTGAQSPVIVPEALPARFLSKIAVDLRGCWTWQAATGSGGYGVFKLHRGKTVQAHRYALTLSAGEPQPGMEARHSCHNPKCCNPAHLCWGTRAENEADKRARLTPTPAAPHMGGESL